MIVIEVIPFKTFKKRLQLVKEYEKKGMVRVYSDYVYVEIHEKERATDELYKRGGRVFKKLL